ncbi:hypothetical protein BST27_30785 [Mycobacterium intermedium]|uniref:Uncharacterized protein n=1 Tax=Mycobacterium intermedium TaxID=28445 RepID=A0A1E3RV85_MYCIE|nr:hypothetical protein BHQ20_29755 [Mycobacterium intermedium]ORA84604.1 hypothetical protein BST27_30785 [Mycobacterium intermedium]
MLNQTIHSAVAKLGLVDVAPRALPADEFVLNDPMVSTRELSSASPTEPTRDPHFHRRADGCRPPEVY